MDVLVAVDILLGLSLVYLLFSLAVTSLNEFIAAVWSSRAKWLRKGIAGLLSADPAELAVKDADAVLRSPFVSYLGTPGMWKTFSTTSVAPWSLMQAVLSGAKGFKEDAFASVASIRALAGELPEKSPIRVVLIDLCARAGDDLDTFREGLDAWFVSFEAQLTNWYRQKTQYVVVALSAAVVVSMNVDTIDIVRKLSADPELRKAVVEQALEASKAESLDELIDAAARNEARKERDAAAETLNAAKSALAACPAAGDAGKKCDRTALEAAVSEAETQLASGRALLEKEQAALEQRIAERADALSDTGLKLGWQEGAFTTWLSELKGLHGFDKLIGLLLSTFAVALGAPFWFSTLKSVASVRSTATGVAERKPPTSAGAADAAR